MIKVVKPGLYTSIQDLGRTGYRNFGVPVSGVMDSYAAKWSNVILGNKEADAVMEITLQGPELLFLKPTQLAITGANLSPNINGNAIEMNRTFFVQESDQLHFGERVKGMRSYLAIKGGFKTEKVFNSRSFYKNITEKSTLEKDDKLLFKSTFENQTSSSIELKHQDEYFEQNELAVYKGPEFDLLNEQQVEHLFTTSFTLGINNRMAYQIKETLENDLTPILSSAVLPGTVQLTRSGKMIVLMRDCQTTGGYPRILQLSEPAINCMAQKMQHEPVRFTLIGCN